MARGKDFVSVAEAARRLGISRQRMHVLLSSFGAPSPVASCGSVKLWDWGQIERFLSERLTAEVLRRVGPGFQVVAVDGREFKAPPLRGPRRAAAAAPGRRSRRPAQED